MRRPRSSRTLPVAARTSHKGQSRRPFGPPLKRPAARGGDGGGWRGGREEPQGPERAAVRAPFEAPVGEGVVRRDLASVVDDLGGAEVDRMVGAIRAARPPRPPL